MKITLDYLKQTYEIKDYLWYTRPYELNIFGIRGMSPKGFHDNDLGIYNDTLGCAFIDDYQNEHLFMWLGTVDSGTYYLENPMNIKGTAKLHTGQYVDTYKIDYHNGKYLALCQRLGPVLLYRVKDLSQYHNNNFHNTEVGYFGINLHKGRDEVEDIGKYSAGCQVFHDCESFELLMALCQIHKERYGNVFTYTLLNKDNIMET